jgi:hypothetical protein
MRSTLAFIFTFVSFVFVAQINEEFSDGDFSNNPNWTGTSSDFIVNTELKLQLNNTEAATSYLSLMNDLNPQNNNEWRYWVKQSFSPSSANYGQIFLSADNADLNLCLNGYYLQLGEAGTVDALRLFQLVDGNSTEICSGAPGLISSSFEIAIKVKRTDTGEWSLFCDYEGGTNYTLIGSGLNSGDLDQSFSGISCTYTASNASKFYFDDIYIGQEELDITPPTCVSANVMSPLEIDLNFDETLNQSSAENIINYSISPSLEINVASIDPALSNLVHLSLSSPLINGDSYELLIENIEDLQGNTSMQQSFNLSYLIGETPQPGDVLISEFFPDPTPSVGLPESEFVEIYNQSEKIFDLSDWKLKDATSSGTIQEGWLMPYSYAILTAAANTDSFDVIFAVSSFPSLNNAGDELSIHSAEGLLIDALTYTDEWYRDSEKESGGYTLERINLDDPCSDALNWSASNSSNGGTPGEQNSIFDDTEDTTPANITSLLALSPNYLQVTFNEGIDSSTLEDIAFVASPSLTISNTYTESTYSNGLIFAFNEALSPSQIYTFELENIKDCWSNSASLQGSFALPESANPGDLIINEILSNPYSGGEDWVELYNKSDKFIDLFQWQFANYQDDTLANFKSIDYHSTLAPGAYVVVGEDALFVIENYPNHNAAAFLNNELPSYSNDSGTVVLLQGNDVMDKVSYEKDWHLSVIDNLDGVSLERIDPQGESGNSFNWHSAAQDIGFATPGLKNSQFIPAVYSGEFSFTNPIFSPDNDGFQDILQVNYKLNAEGLLGKVSIYDDKGRVIKNLFQNLLLGASGTFSWDGMADDNQKSAIGTYVMVFEAFSTDGSVFFTQIKAFTLAGKI